MVSPVLEFNCFGVRTKKVEFFTSRFCFKKKRIPTCEKLDFFNGI